MNERDEFESWLKNKIKFTAFMLATAGMVWVAYQLFKRLFRRGS